MVVEKAPEAVAGELQRSRRKRYRQAHVSRRVQAPSVHRAGERLLRVAQKARRQAAVFHQRRGWRPSRVRDPNELDFQFSSISPVAIFITLTAFAIMSALLAFRAVGHLIAFLEALR
jgi:hypothetical protein